MIGFNDLPNEMILELWKQVLQPDDIVSFALVSKRIFAFATPFLKEYHGLKSTYAVQITGGALRGSKFAHILKDILLHPYIALYIKDVNVWYWQTCWDHPDLRSCYPDLPTSMFHLPYPEQDMELFRSAIRKSEYVHASEVDDWIQLLESGNEDPILALLLSLLPNLCKLSLEQKYPGILLSTTIRRIAETTPSTSFSRLRNVDLTEMISSRQKDGMALIKPFLILPSVEKLVCRNLDFHPRGHGTPDCLMAPHSSNVSELVLRSCGESEHSIAMLVSGIKRLKSFTYVPARKGNHVTRILSALSHHCRNSLECLRLEEFGGRRESKYTDKLSSLRSFENLKTLDVQHSLLVDLIADDNIDVAEFLPTSIESFTMRGQHLEIADHICPLTRNLVKAKRTQLPNLKRLSYHSFEYDHIPQSSSSKRSCLHVYLTDIYRKCEKNDVMLDIQVFHPGVKGPCQIYRSNPTLLDGNTRTFLNPPYEIVHDFSPEGQCQECHNI